MNKLRLYLVDDERSARDLIRNLLIDVEGIEIVGEADSVESGLTEVIRIKPDVILLDIQMPRQDGFSLISQLQEKDVHPEIIFTAADCTGHGVPGAFMSMLGVSYLNQIVHEENTVMPNEILDKLRAHIINSFAQREHEEGDRKDGMDIALCSFNTKTNKLYYAGAYNPLFLINHDGEEPELTEHSADKMPVGLYAIMDGFQTAEIEFKKGDSIYMFSDGFPDQFGGERFKKFMKKRFREMILSNQDKTFDEQKKIYDDTLEDWMRFRDPEGEEIIQTDDVLVIGVKL